MKVPWLSQALVLLISQSAAAIVPPAAWDMGQAPAVIPSDSQIATASEPGTPLVIRGTVYAPDGTTPLAGVVVYAYHTDVNGLYRADHRMDAPPRLRGWARTDSKGHYSFRTIRPAPYPKNNIPAHVHFHVWGPGVPRQFVDDLHFADDPLIGPRQVSEASIRGSFSTLCAPEGTTDGGELCTFNIQVRAQSNFR